ncbi:hypothetical protein FRC12_001539 [Ceratobasidium sp. 428]|nr:hypothetical protein FRC12_001539 [Ceratobasidium sp. 428]
MGDDDMIITGLVRLIASASVNNTPSLELVAGRALHTMFPMLLQQWMRMVAELPEVGLAPDSEKMQFVQLALNAWPSNPGPDHSESLANWTLRQLIIVAAISVSLADSGRRYMSYLPGVALKALYDRARLHATFDPNSQDFFLLTRLVDYACSNFDRIDRILDDNSEYSATPAKLVLQLLGIKHLDGHLFARDWCASSSLSSLFRLTSLTNYDLTETKKILSFIQLEVQRELSLWLWDYSYWFCAFAADSRCFSELLSLGLREEYSPLVLECVDSIINSIYQAITSGDRQEAARRGITSSFIPDAVLFVVRQTIKTNRDQLRAFVSKVVEIFTNLSREAQETLRRQPAIDSICEELTAVAQYHEEVVEPINSFIKWANIYEGITQLLIDGSNDNDSEIE